MSDEQSVSTFIDGVGASEVIDSSGEKIIIKGVDISSLVRGTGGVFNWEHKSDEPSKIVGKILIAKKILKRSDCEGERQTYFWDKIKVPYIYVAGELFDGVDHGSAKDVAAMLRYDKNVDKRKAKKLIHFSIEGSKIDKKGSIIHKCIARKVSITITPCNHTCEAEQLEKPETAMKTKKSVIDKILSKSEDNYVEILKSEYNAALKFKLKDKKPSSKKDYSKITPATGEHREGSTIKPKRTFKPDTAPKKDMKVGDRIDYSSKKKPRSGASIYKDPDTFKDEKGVHNPIKKDPKGGKSKAGVLNSLKNKAVKDQNTRHEIYAEIDQKREHKKVLNEQKQMKKPNLPKSEKYQSNMRKAITAACGVGSAPSVKTQSEALQKENIEKEVKQLCKSISNDNWETFEKKEQLISFLTDKLPNKSTREIMALAKTVAFVHNKKREKQLMELLDE